MTSMTTSQHHRTACKDAYHEQNSKNTFMMAKLPGSHVASKLYISNLALGRLGVLSPEQAHL